jgi:hypothetical protein
MRLQYLNFLKILKIMNYVKTVIKKKTNLKLIFFFFIILKKKHNKTVRILTQVG